MSAPVSFSSSSSSSSVSGTPPVVASLDPSSSSSQINKERVRLIFADERHEVCDMISLQELGFFSRIASHHFKENEEHVFNFPECKHAHFKVVYALICEKKPIHAAIPEYLLGSSTLFEDLVSALHYFQQCDEVDALALHEMYTTDPKIAAQIKVDQKKAAELKQLIVKLKKALLHLMTLKTAEKMMMACHAELHDDIAPSNVSHIILSSSSSLIATPIKESYLMLVAVAKVFQSRVFPSLDQAEERFENIRACHIEIELAESHRARLEASLARLPSVAHTARVEQAIKKQNVIIQEREQRMAQLMKDLLLEDRLKGEFPLNKLQKLSSFINDSNPLTRRVAVISKRELEAYSEKVIPILKRQGTDLSRVDLLEYVVGPKAYLFDHYGIKVSVNSSAVSYLSKNDKEYFYNLENSSSFDLENEIREDVRIHGPLPTRLIHEKVVTKVVSPAAIALKEKIVTLWQEVCRNPEARDSIKKELIQLFNWDPNLVKASDIVLWVIQEVTKDRISVVVRATQRQVVLDIENIATMHPADNRNSSVVYKMPAFDTLKNDRGYYTCDVSDRKDLLEDYFMRRN